MNQPISLLLRALALVTSVSCKLASLSPFKSVGVIDGCLASSSIKSCCSCVYVFHCPIDCTLLNLPVNHSATPTALANVGISTSFNCVSLLYPLSFITLLSHVVLSVAYFLLRSSIVDEPFKPVVVLPLCLSVRSFIRALYPCSALPNIV